MAQSKETQKWKDKHDTYWTQLSHLFHLSLFLCFVFHSICFHFVWFLELEVLRIVKFGDALNRGCMTERVLLRFLDQ